MPQAHGARWECWDQVPHDAHLVASAGPWFLEIFSGAAHLTSAVRKAGIPCLPPIDITLCTAIPVAFDVVDVDRWQFVMQLIFLGAVWFAHFGTPCNTYLVLVKRVMVVLRHCGVQSSLTVSQGCQMSINIKCFWAISFETAHVKLVLL